MGNPILLEYILVHPLQMKTRDKNARNLFVFGTQMLDTRPYI